MPRAIWSESTFYAVMDGRAANDPDDASIFLATDDPEEACEVANKGDYGVDVLVVRNATEVMWEWLASGKWKVAHG